MGRQRGQSTVEYAIVITVIIAALLAMQIYIKRGAMGKLKDATDQIGEQFSPMLATQNMNRHYNSDHNEILTTDGKLVTQNMQEDQTRTGEEHRTTNLADEPTLF